MSAFNAVGGPALGKIARRWLYLVHRWIGIASCLLFAMWFLSGLVMLYVPYPSLSPAEKLAGGEAIDWAAVDVPPPLESGRLPQELLLDMRDGMPVWRVTGGTGRTPRSRPVAVPFCDPSMLVTPVGSPLASETHRRSMSND